MRRDLDERWQQLKGELERRVEGKGAFDPAKGGNPLEGLTLPEMLGIMQQFTGGLFLQELKNFAADPTITPDSFVDRLFEIVKNLLATADEALLNDLNELAIPLFNQNLADLKARVKQGLRSRRPAPLPELLQLPADLIVKRSFEAFLPGNMTRETNNMGFFAAYSWGDKPGKRLHTEGFIGYEDNPGEAVWKFTQTRGAMLAKLQLALWARTYEANPNPGEDIELSIVQLCDDLGYKRKKGGHRRERKIEVGQALRCLWKLQVEARPVVQGKTVKLSGPLWAKGMQLDYEDLFDWVPCVVQFSVGRWFHQPTWRALNTQLATVSAGALLLSTEKGDQAAVFLACYFATLTRMNGNRPVSRLKAETLADQSGLRQTYTRPGRLQEAVERALDRLVDVGVVKRYRLDTADPCADPDDLGNPETLASLANDGAKVGRHWLRQVYEIEWPDKVIQSGAAIAKGKAQHAKRLNAQPSRRSKGKA
jgi:hypothetical protein